MVFSHQDCFAGQRPGWPGAARVGGAKGCFGEHLAEEGVVLLHVGMVGALFLSIHYSAT